MPVRQRSDGLSVKHEVEPVRDLDHPPISADRVRLPDRATGHQQAHGGGVRGEEVLEGGLRLVGGRSVRERDGNGRATVSLYNFDTTVRPRYRAIPIEDAPEWDDDSYTPDGRTALFDALSTAVREATSRIEGMPPYERPDTVVVVVLTDGKENASETPETTVRELVETRREEHGWEFLFIGANQDAALTAQKVGIDADRSLDMAHSGEGVREAQRSTSEAFTTARSSGRSDGFDADDRRRQDDASDS